jgi:hypothetical protein
MRAAGGNHATLRKYAEQIWRIPTDHFDPHASQRIQLATRVPRPLSEYLTQHSSYSRGALKRRLFAEGVKERRCELCGVGERWQGRPMSLVLDHINGVADDNRLENFQIVCPNCAATLDTHCGRNSRLPHEERVCLHCGTPFLPRHERHRYCSRACGQRAPGIRAAQVAGRRVERPPYEQLVAGIEARGYLAVGRKYGVSDNAIRKWRRAYEAAAESTAGAV